MYHGLINVYKEPNYTSMDVVSILRGILKQKKIGHTGTLDPMAEGVLLVCLGSGTKLCNMLEDHTKEYRCTMLLGQATDTEDTTGNVTNTGDVPEDEELIKNVIMSFVGDYDQIPPMYSAIKKSGKKLYELAREGIEIEREPRRIVINSICVERINLPRITFTVNCSKGTYVRSLCRDIGLKLGTYGCMEHLLRTSASGYIYENALTLDRISELVKEGRIDEYIVSIEDIFRECKALNVKEESSRFIDNGNPLVLDNFVENPIYEDDELFRVYDSKGIFRAVYKYVKDKDLFMPEKMFMDIDK